MKIFANKRTIKKISIILLIIIVFNFGISSEVNASSSSIGGVLLKPVVNLFVAVGDGIVEILHYTLVQQSGTLIHINTGSITSKWWVKIGLNVISGGTYWARELGKKIAKEVVETVLGKDGLDIDSIGPGSTISITVDGEVIGAPILKEEYLEEDKYLPVYTLSPEEIFSNKVAIFDVDFFNPNEEQNSNGEYKSIAYQLREIISNWYQILRNMALVALLSILVYIGIRIIISSASNDKAKYKSLLMDWVIAIVLLFVMHYVMAGSNLIVKKVTELISSAKRPFYVALIEDDGGKLKKGLESDKNISALRSYGLLGENESIDTIFTEINDKSFLKWSTNLMGVARLHAQESKDSGIIFVGYACIYIILVLFTIYFSFTYLKRVIYMAFLTLISPLVALTYPIDKMNDGKAQAFNMWFKEYIFNLLIQPLHLLLYTVLVSSALQLATVNIIYCIVAISFMIPAEKLLRKFFGFEKAQTPGLLGGAAGSALAWSGMQRIMGHKMGRKPPEHQEVSKTNNHIKEAKNFDSDFNSTDTIINSEMSNINNNNSGIGKNNNLQKSLSSSGSTNSNIQSVNNRNRGQYGNNNSITPINSNFNKKHESKARKVIRGVSRAAGAGLNSYGRELKYRAKNKIRNMHPIRTTGKIMAGATGATVLGMAGLLIGASSGDMSKTFQYGIAGATGGFNMTKGIPNNFAISDDVKERAKRAYYENEEEYEEAERKKYIKSLRENVSFMNRLEDKYGESEAKYVMKEVIPDLVNSGISDEKDMLAAYDLERNGIDGNRVDRDMAIATAKYSARIGKNTKNMNLKDKNEWIKTFASEFADNNTVKNNKLDQNEMAIKLFNRIIEYNKYKYKDN